MATFLKCRLLVWIMGLSLCLAPDILLAEHPDDCWCGVINDKTTQYLKFSGETCMLNEKGPCSSDSGVKSCCYSQDGQNLTLHLCKSDGEFELTGVWSGTEIAGNWEQTSPEKKPHPKGEFKFEQTTTCACPF